MSEKIRALLSLIIFFSIIILLLVLCYRWGYHNGQIASIPKELVACCTKNQESMFWVNIS